MPSAVAWLLALALSPLHALLCIQDSTGTHLRMLQHKGQGFFKVLQAHITQILREVVKSEVSQSKYSKTVPRQEAGPVLTQATATSKQVDDPRESPLACRAQHSTSQNALAVKGDLGIRILAISEKVFEVGDADGLKYL